MENEKRSRAGESATSREAGEKRVKKNKKNKRSSGREEAVNIEKRLQRCAPGKARKQKKIKPQPRLKLTVAPYEHH